jgi:hypothetical protein
VFEKIDNFDPSNWLTPRDAFSRSERISRCFGRHEMKARRSLITCIRARAWNGIADCMFAADREFKEFLYRPAEAHKPEAVAAPLASGKRGRNKKQSEG